MVTTEQKVEVKLKAPLAEYMEARDMTVRELHYKVCDHKFKVSRGTIGHLRKNRDRAVHPELAKRIAKALDIPHSILFTVKSSNVQREVAPKGKAA